MDWAAPNLPVTSPNEGAVSSPPRHAIHKLDKELARLDQSVPFRPKAGYLHHTWAQTFFSRPEFFFQPSTLPELQKIVTLARRLRKRLCVTGFGHSPSDLTCTSSWLINLDHLDRVLDLSDDGLVRFEAGISLHALNLYLAKHNFTLPNLGSIDVQSVAGSIATGTHGSSLIHGLLSQGVTSLTILLTNGQLVSCSATKNTDLFRAALLSLGSLGVIVEITYQAVPDFNISWSQALWTLDYVLATWDTDLWKTGEYTRVWWLPYLHRAVIWRAEHTDAPVRAPNTTFYGGKLGYYLYHNLLALSNYVPRILPWVEWFVFGMQYGFRPGSFSMSAVQPARDGLLMDCLYSQFVNEWAIPLAKGPEAITRLSAWLHGDERAAQIPFSSKGLWVHCPVEVRVSDTTLPNFNASRVRPFLDPTRDDGPTLYLNATLYRPYGRDPPCRHRYYEAFEWLMRDLGGRPHWAKNFAFTARREIAEMYGADLARFLAVRDDADPQGMWLGAWHGRNLPVASCREKETEKEGGRKGVGRRFGDGVLWEGSVVDLDNADGKQRNADADADADVDATPSPPVTSNSEESFDYMAKGEASVHHGV